MSKSASQLFFIVASACALTAVFGLGLGTGVLFYPAIFHAEAEHDDEHDHDHDDHAGEDVSDPHAEEEHEEVVALSEQAVKNIALELGTVGRGDYQKSILVPAEIVEIPGRSDLSVSAAVAGVIEQVRVVPGESLAGDQTLFTLRITDSGLTDAQSQLLATLARQDIVRQEIERLTPFVQSGAVSGAKKRDYEYELQQLQSDGATLTQELRGRGLPDEVIQSVVQNRELATTLAIAAPMASTEVEPTADRYRTQADALGGYSIESLLVHPGKSVSRGDDLCTLAYHAELYVEGTAFESDLKVLQRIAENGWLISADTQEDAHGSAHQVGEKGLQLLRIDNHVDEQSQTVRFYSILKNDVTRVLSDAEGRLFQQWQYRPGQRVHLRLPTEKWTNQLTLPIGAVVHDGPNAYVFAQHIHQHDDHDRDQDRSHMDSTSQGGHAHANSAADPAHDDDSQHTHPHETGVEEPYLELEPIPVHVLHHDDQRVVLADDGQLSADTKVALNNAYKIFLALKMQAGGGGGHHHHDH